MNHPRCGFAVAPGGGNAGGSAEPMPRRRLAWLRSLFVVFIGGMAVGAMAQPQADPATLDYRLSARALAPDVYVVEGANADFSRANGCNIINTGFIVAEDGVIVINTGPSKRYGEQLRALIGRTTAKPVRQVLHLNLHPDYFLGNQAFADVPRLATAATIEGMRAEAKSYEDNLYRLCGDWMKATEAVLPDRTVMPGPLLPGNPRFELRELKGHTASDLVLIDRTSGVVFAGGLVFVDRVPTTPHARLSDWLLSLDALAAQPFKTLVPSHGPVVGDGRGIEQTRRYLRWLDSSFGAAAQRGSEMTEVLAQPVPTEFRNWAALATEYPRNVVHLYPAYELKSLQAR